MAYLILVNVCISRMPCPGYYSLFQEFRQSLEIILEGKQIDVGSEEVMQKYVRECVKLCLLMNANDPPVVIECPGWKRSGQSRDFKKAEATNRHHGIKDKTLAFDQDIEMLDWRTAGEYRKIRIDIDPEEMPIERSKFNRDIFKDYTRRGSYLEYVVWPAMFLHDNGPLLNKGVAQGTAN